MKYNVKKIYAPYSKFDLNIRFVLVEKHKTNINLGLNYVCTINDCPIYYDKYYPNPNFIRVVSELSGNLKTVFTGIHPELIKVDSFVIQKIVYKIYEQKNVTN